MSYLLDTNVISELRKRRSSRSSPAVAAWYDGVGDHEIYFSALVMGELRQGIEQRRLRDPQAAAALERWLSGLLRRHRERILPVTSAIADRWGRLCPSQPLPDVDGLLVATALEHDFTLVTRNVDDVARSGVRLLNPFTWPSVGNTDPSTL